MKLNILFFTIVLGFNANAINVSKECIESCSTKFPTKPYMPVQNAELYDRNIENYSACYKSCEDKLMENKNKI